MIDVCMYYIVLFSSGHNKPLGSQPRNSPTKTSAPLKSVEDVIIKEDIKSGGDESIQVEQAVPFHQDVQEIALQEENVDSRVAALDLTPINIQQSISPPVEIINSAHVKQIPLADPFEQFKQVEGAQHHTDYEASKQTIKDLKALQKTLVQSVNAAKANIDSISERLNELNSESIATLRESNEGEIAALKVTLSESKQLYRTKRGDLLRVKEDLAAVTLKKQQLLKDLVTAFEAHQLQQHDEQQQDEQQQDEQQHDEQQQGEEQVEQDEQDEGQQQES